MRGASGVVQESTRGRRNPLHGETGFIRLSPTGNNPTETSTVAYKCYIAPCFHIAICSKYHITHTTRQIAAVSLQILKYNLVSGIKSCIFAVCRMRCFLSFIQNKQLFVLGKHLQNAKGGQQTIATKLQQQATKRQVSKSP